jgi:hypothetical protein
MGNSKELNEIADQLESGNGDYLYGYDGIIVYDNYELPNH